MRLLVGSQLLYGYSYDNIYFLEKNKVYNFLMNSIGFKIYKPTSLNKIQIQMTALLKGIVYCRYTHIPGLKFFEQLQSTEGNRLNWYMPDYIDKPSSSQLFILNPRDPSVKY